MIIFIENGGIGNQVIQYGGLKKYCKSETIIIMGCDELGANFNLEDVYLITRNKINRWFSFEILKKIIFFLSFFRIFSQITEIEDPNEFKIDIRRGLFWNIKIPYGVYFQHADSIEKNEFMPRMKQSLRAKADHWIKENIKNIEFKELVFVHIRRGDYLTWPSKQFPAVLNLFWYKNAMEIMKKKLQDPIFVLMSDDFYYLKDVFEETDKLIISNNSMEIDLAIMSRCHSGIMSASTFALCGALYAKFNEKNEATFIAPKYWCGHRIKKWFPINIRTEYITYKE